MTVQKQKCSSIEEARAVRDQELKTMNKLSIPADRVRVRIRARRDGTFDVLVKEPK